MGIGASIILMVQNCAQRSVSANRATSTYALEPMWAGLFSYCFGKNCFIRQSLGGALIIANVVLSKK
jgi:drug/metabolite transporter (DMT)-like permease